MAHHLAPLEPEEHKRVETVLALYLLPEGESVIERNTIGLVNKTYVITRGNTKLVLRESSSVTVLEHLELETEVLEYLSKENFPLSARLLLNKEGKGLTEHDGRYYLLQTFLSGEVKATITNLENFTPEMLSNFFAASARFTRAVAGFKPSKPYSNEPLSFYLETGATHLRQAVDSLPESPGRALALGTYEGMRSFLERTRAEFDDVHYDALPKQLVHFDLHPGNVHFDEANRVVGLFDFDWIRFDSRITDIAATIGQSCYIYGGEETGKYVKENIALGLAAYREAYGMSEFTLETENRLIRIALQAYMFFQAVWVIDWYRENSKDPSAMLFLQHFLNVCLVNDYERLFS